MNQEMAQAIYDQAMSLWVHPEILERHERREIINLPLVLTAAQIILGMDGSYKVRLNGEIKGKLIAKSTRAVKAGEHVTFNDIEDLHLAERDPEDLDFGHVTLISQGDDKWSISFSFIYGIEKVGSYLKIGKEFLDQAKVSLEVSRRVTLALGTTAGENLLKARLATSPLVSLKTNTHSGLVNLLGQFTKMTSKKQIRPEYNDAIKFFHKHFNGVRYEPSYPKIHKATLRKNIRILEQLYSETQAIVDRIDTRSLEQRQIRITPSPSGSS